MQGLIRSEILKAAVKWLCGANIPTLVVGMMCLNQKGYTCIPLGLKDIRRMKTRAVKGGGGRSEIVFFLNRDIEKGRKKTHSTLRERNTRKEELY